MKMLRNILWVSLPAIVISLAWFHWAMMGIETLPKSKVLEADLMTFSSALSMYRLNSGELPSIEDGLSALVVRPVSLSSERRWSQILPRIWMDPWGEPYVYERAFDGQRSSLRIYSRSSDLSNPREILVISNDANPSELSEAEQVGTEKPATRAQSKSEGNEKPQPEAEGRSR